MADQKLTALTAVTDATGDDLIYIVDDPGGTPLARKITVTNLLKLLTSPTINTSVSGTAVLDEDNMASDSDTQIATQQSIKAYVDLRLLLTGGTLSGELDFSGTNHAGITVISLTTAQRDALGAVNTGAIIYNTTTTQLEVYTGAAWEAIGGGSGDVVGPGSSTDNAITRFDSTTGKLLQNSSVTINDSGDVTLPNAGDISPGNSLGGSSIGGTQIFSYARAGYLSLEADSAAAPGIRYRVDADTGLFRPAADAISLSAGAAEALRADKNATAGNTRLLIYDVDNGTLERVSVGAADSGGAGYKVLRIAN